MLCCNGVNDPFLPDVVAVFYVLVTCCWWAIDGDRPTLAKVASHAFSHFFLGGHILSDGVAIKILIFTGRGF